MKQNRHWTGFMKALDNYNLVSMLNILSMAKYGKVWQSMAKYGKVWQRMPKNAKVCQNTLKLYNSLLMYSFLTTFLQC